jgi:hypothetical protein
LGCGAHRRVNQEEITPYSEHCIIRLVGGRTRGEVIRDARGRRVSERDRYGAEVARLRWAPDGRLADAAVRLPGGSWLSVEPGAADDPRWGISDGLRHEGESLTHFAALQWSRVDTIPPLAEPARLPAGAGTAVLNLVAGLAADQQAGPLTYRGPYPTEQLFLALLECFRWESEADETDPLAAFMAGGLRWRPAPHARAFAPHGVYVQSRDQVEKIVWQGRTYVREDWRGVGRHAAHRVHEAGGQVHGALWALGAPLEDHLVLARDGTVLTAVLPPADVTPVAPVPAVVAAGLIAVIVAASAPPLAASLRAVAAPLAFAWAPIPGELATLDGERVRLSPRLRGALALRAAAAESRAEQVRLGFAALAELAHALGDGLRARAQARLATASPAAQAAALEAGRLPADAAARAREIGTAVEALLEDAAQLLA